MTHLFAGQICSEDIRYRIFASKKVFDLEGVLQGVFVTGAPPKISKYKKVNLG